MTDTRSTALSRRRLLGAGVTAAVGSLAGCAAVTGSESEENADGPLGGHPAASNGLADQPRLGPPPTEAEGVVVAFEDPSCPRCAAFEKQTVPKLRDRLGDEVSFVLRTYPVVYPWGEPATQAIEAAFARETDAAEPSDDGDGSAPADAPYGARQGSTATWKLVRHYFEEQDAFDRDNVFERTRQFLARETDLDAAAVVEDAENEASDDAVQADLSAGEAADAGRTTPVVFLFRDGEFRTSAEGSVSYQVIESALGL